ncbi:hypothetical protein INR49_008380 [Caranx melampygus]|nr:hypothetical protein INR49_008380 [Caranx melampygus]
MARKLSKHDPSSASWMEGWLEKGGLFTCSPVATASTLSQSQLPDAERQHGHQQQGVQDQDQGADPPPPLCTGAGHHGCFTLSVHYSMQVHKVVFLYSLVTMLKPTASGTARTMDSSQITTISTAVTVGIPVPCTRDQEVTARYLCTSPDSRGLFMVSCSRCDSRSEVWIRWSALSSGGRVVLWKSGMSDIV